MSQEPPKAYDPKTVEDGIYKTWKQSGFFNPDKLPGKRTQNFSISLPPPNATGILHIGHAVMLAIEDLLIRFERMRGKKTLWLPGTDHAAIATQNVVELDLKAEGKTKHDLGREAFLKRVDSYVAAKRGTITEQIKRLGSSCDWSREKFTLDAGLSNAVNTAFKTLYDDSLIYRGDRIVNWCPRCQSTLADDEVEYQEKKTPFYYFKYGPVVIGTARPETKFGDKVIVVHPDDKRYRQLVNKEFEVDWILGKIKARVIADPVIDPELGTGAMTITPGHSFEDFALAQKYNIPIEKIINENGRLTEAAGSMNGLPVKEARKKVVEILESKGLVDHIDENYTHYLSVCYRCGTPVEPLVSKQWFVAVDKPTKRLGGKALKQRALEVVSKNETRFVPGRFAKVYRQWVENLHDWCISRQIWYGHRIPIWYCGGQVKADQPKMGFHIDVVPQVYDGKTKTYRLRDHGFRVGDRVLFENTQTRTLFGYGLITDVEKTLVNKIDYRDKTHFKTYRNLDELIAAFKLRNPDKEVTPTSTAYLYTYEFHKFTEQDADDGCGQIIVSSDQPENCPACKGHNLVKDTDTLDTWFSSSLWTFSTLGWPKKTKDLETFHPTSVMETGYDIIFFWVARMILMSTYLVGEIPFKTVYLHGLVRDIKGRKMSKSLGNGIDPLEMADKYGADAVRLSLVIGTTPGNDQRLSEEKIAGFRNYVNKIWNIGRFLALQDTKEKAGAPKIQTLADEWIASRLNNLTQEHTSHLEKFEFSLAGEKIYDFAWHEFADWYLEITKLEGNVALARQVFSVILKLIHPYMPFVTERLWQQLGYGKKLLMIESWPAPEPSRINPEIEQEFSKLQKIIIDYRRQRKEAGIPAGESIAITLDKGSPLWQHQAIIERLAKIHLELKS